MAFAKVCDIYLQEGCETKKPSTIATDRGRIERHIKKTAADEKTKLHGRAIVEGGKGTATRTVGLLGGIMTFAVSRQLRADNRRVSSKRPCGPDKLYCMVCHAPRRPALDVADYTPLTESVGALVALCTDYGGVMTQRVNVARLKLFSAEIEVTIRLAPEPIEGSA